MAERAVDELLSSAPGASGALCVDSTGLAMACRGDLTSSQSGFVRGLSSKAASLGLGKRGEEPVVAIHTETRYGLRKVPPPTPPFRPASPICTATVGCAPPTLACVMPAPLRISHPCLPTPSEIVVKQNDRYTMALAVNK